MKVRLIIEQSMKLSAVVEATEEDLLAIERGEYEINWEGVDKHSDHTVEKVYTDPITEEDEDVYCYDIDWYIDIDKNED